MVSQIRKIAMEQNTGEDPALVRSLWRISTSLMASRNYLEEANEDRQANIRITLTDNLQAQLDQDDQLVRDRMGGITVREFVGHQPEAQLSPLRPLRLIRGEIEHIQERVPETEPTRAESENRAQGSGRAAKRRRTERD